MKYQTSAKLFKLFSWLIIISLVHSLFIPILQAHSQPKSPINHQGENAIIQPNTPFSHSKMAPVNLPIQIKEAFLNQQPVTDTLVSNPLVTPLLQMTNLSIAPQQSNAYTNTTTISPAIPAETEKPLVLARVQSAYTPAGLVSSTVIISYTAVNRLKTDTLYNAQLTLQLAPGVSLVAGPGHVILADGSLAFNLGDLTYAEGSSVALTLSVPPTPGLMVTDATVQASYGNRLISAQTAPAQLIADIYANELGQQPEFMFNDIDLLTVAGLVEQDPVAAFELVRDATDYEAYQGSLRGARGTWWSEAGNSLDRTSFLLGILRTGGIPAHYISGTLTLTQQQTLLAQMFDDTLTQIGSITPEQMYDPFNDPNLLALTAPHYWVEAYFDGAWHTLDPNFKDSQVDTIYGANPSSFLTIPDSQRHHTQVVIAVEQLPAFLGESGQINTFIAFDITLPTAQIAGLPLIIGHFVETTNNGAVPFYTINHYYTPFISLGEAQIGSTIYRGGTYQELISNYPFGEQRVVASSVEVSISGPTSASPSRAYAESHREYIVDRIGPTGRRYGYTLEQVGGTEPIVKDREGPVLIVAPNWIPDYAVARKYGRAQAQTTLIKDMHYALSPTIVLSETITPQVKQRISFMEHQLTVAQSNMAAATALQTLSQSDKITRLYGQSMQVHPYFNSPRLFVSQNNIYTETEAVVLRHNWLRKEISFIPYPTQNEVAVISARLTYGLDTITQEFLSHLALVEGDYRQVKSTISVFIAAMEDNINLIPIFPYNVSAVEMLQVDADTKTRILEALEDKGRFVIVPEKPVMVGGEPYLAWLEIDEATGNIYDQDQNGKHPGYLLYKIVDPGKCHTSQNCRQTLAFLGFVDGIVSRGLNYLVASLTVSFFDSDVCDWVTFSPTKNALCRQNTTKTILFLDKLMWSIVHMVTRFLTTSCSPSPYWVGINQKILPGLHDILVLYCDDFIAGLINAGIKSVNDIYQAVSDPIKLSKLYRLFSSANETGALGGFLSIDAASGSFVRAGGFFHGARFAGFMLPFLQNEDPLLPFGVNIGQTTNPIPNQTTTYTATLTNTLPLDTLNATFSTPHLLWQQPGAFTLNGGHIVVAGGPFAQLQTPQVIVETTNGESTILTDVTITLPDEGNSLAQKQAFTATLTPNQAIHLSGADSFSLQTQTSQLNANTTLTPTHSLTLTASTNQMAHLHLPAGSFINGIPTDEGTTLVITQVTMLDPGHVSWLGETLTPPQSAQALYIGPFTGNLNTLNDAPAATLQNWNGTSTLNANNNLLTLTLSGNVSWLGSAQPSWTTTSNQTTLAPNFSLSQGDTYTISFTTSNDYFNLPPTELTEGAVQLTRQPTSLSSSTAQAGFTLRANANQAALLVFQTEETLPSRPRTVALETSLNSLIQLPWGEDMSDLLPNAVYLSTITYTSDISGVFSLSQTGLPADWVDIAQPTFTFKAGQVVQTSLIVSPTLGNLPAPGTQIPFTITLQETNGPLNVTNTTTWSAPEGGLPRVLWLKDREIREELHSGESVTLTLLVANGGVVTDTFTLTTTNYISLTGPISVTVGPEDFVIMPISYTMQGITGTRVPVAAFLRGRDYLVADSTILHNYPARTLPLTQWAYDHRASCDSALADSVFYLADALAFYDIGSAARENITFQAEQVSQIMDACLNVITMTTGLAPGIFTATQSVETALNLLPDEISPLIIALNALDAQLVPYQWIWPQSDGQSTYNLYKNAMQVSPDSQLARVNQGVTYTIQIAHQGTLSGTFILSTTNTAAGDVSTQTLNLAAGAVITLTNQFTPTLPQPYRLRFALLRPDGLPPTEAEITVNAYAQFADLLSVRADPNFVETNNSQTTIYATLENAIVYPLSATLLLTMYTPSGAVYTTTTTQVSHQSQVSTLALANLTLSNLEAGTYLLAAHLLEEDKIVYGRLEAGVGLEVQQTLNPHLVLPGDVTTTLQVTMTIPTAIITTWNPSALTPINPPTTPVITSSGPYTYHSDYVPGPVTTYPGDLIINSDTTWSNDVHIAGTLTVTAKLTLINGVRTITATNIVIPPGGHLSADYQGYGPAQGPGAGFSGVEISPTFIIYSTGGGHGGFAPSSSITNSQSARLGGWAYGDALHPQSLGSGGGNSSDGYSGGRGGGAIHLVVSDTLEVDGLLSSNGETAPAINDPTSLPGSSGSGGSLWLEATTLTGSGLIQTQGGAGVSNGYAAHSMAGSGGRIAIYTANSLFTGDIESFGMPIYFNASWSYGPPGTIYIKENNQATLIVGDDIIGSTSHHYYNDSLAALMPGDYTLANVHIKSRAKLVSLGYTAITTLTNHTLSGVYEGDVSIGEWVISGTLVVPNAFTISDEIRVSVGNTLIGSEDLTLQNWTFLFVEYNRPTWAFKHLAFDLRSGFCFFSDNGDTDYTNDYVEVVAETVSLSNQSTLCAVGYPPDAIGPGAGEAGDKTQGQGGGGGSHAGLGGDGQGGVLGGQVIYGNTYFPTTAGSGGGIFEKEYLPSFDLYAKRSGSAGALHLIVTNTLTLDANSRISTSAGVGNLGAGSGAYAGGSVWVEANTINGNGILTARGGNAQQSFPDNIGGGGGSGGRVALYANTDNFTGSLDCSGGNGGNAQAGNGEDGTCYHAPSLLFYTVDLAHTLPVTQVQPLTQTAQPPVTQVITTGSSYLVQWAGLVISQTNPTQTVPLVLALPNMQAGEVRSVLGGSVLTYTSRNGVGAYYFGGTYVYAPHLVRIAPQQQITPLGQGVTYTVQLANPGAQPTSYTLTLAALPGGWQGTYPTTVALAPQTTISVPVLITPTTAQAGFVKMQVTTSAGGQDSALASLQGRTPFAFRVEPLGDMNNVVGGATVTYQLHLTDVSGLGSVVDLTAIAVDGAAIPLATGLPLPPYGQQTLPFTSTAPFNLGPYLIPITARQGAFALTQLAHLNVQYAPSLDITLEGGTTGPGMPRLLNATVRQTWPGEQLPGAVLSITAPSGWQVSGLPTHLPAEQATLNAQLLVTPPIGTAAGDYPLTMHGVMSDTGEVYQMATSTLTILPYGLAASLAPANLTVASGQPFTLQVVISNTSLLSDTFWLTPTGILALSGEVASPELALNAGASGVVTYTGLVPTWLISQTHPIAIGLQSQQDPTVVGLATGHLQLAGLPHLTATLQPVTRIITNTPQTALGLILYNQGSADARPVTLSVEGSGGSLATLETETIDQMLPHQQRLLPVQIHLPQAGIYFITATVETPLAETIITTATIDYRHQALTLQKRVVPTSQVPYGGQVTYTLILSNVGSAPVTGITLQDSLTPPVSFGYWLEQPPGASVNDNQVTWAGSLSQGTALTLTFVADQTGGYGAQITNTARYSTTDNLRGVARASFVITGVTTLPLLPVGLHKSVNETNPEPGQRITYTLVVSNPNSSPITQVQLVDMLPLSLTLATTPTLAPGGTVIWPLSSPLSTTFTLGAGANITLTLPVSLPWGLAGGTLLTNTAFISQPALSTVVVDTATLAVAPVPPLALDGRDTTPTNTPFSGQLQGWDANGDALSFSLMAGAFNGEVTLLNLVAGTFVYTPNNNFEGTDVFLFMVEDTTGRSDMGQVVITVGPANQPPLARNDIVTTPQNTARTIDVLANDSDPEGAPLTITQIYSASHGSAVLSGPAISYTPENDYAGLDTFDYTISDGALSATATVAVVITRSGSSTGNQAPIFVSQPPTSTLENTLYTYAISTTDAEGDPIMVTGFGLPAWLTLQNQGSGRANLQGSPPLDSAGDYLIALAASDGPGETYQIYSLLVTAGNNGETPHLNLSKRVIVPNPGAVPLGSLITYSLHLSNSSGVPALGLHLTDTLPAGLTFKGWLLQGSATLSQSNTIAWAGDLGGNSAVAISFTTLLTTVSTVAGETMTNVVRYSALNDGPGTATVSFTVAPNPLPENRFIYLPLVLKGF